jgi:hypothetical protein
MLNNLPKYVTSCPDAIPSIRLFEGDLSFVMARLDRIEERLGFRQNSLTSSMAAIVGEVSAINNDTSGRLNRVAWPKPQATESTGAQPATSSVIDKVYRPSNATGNITSDRPTIVDLPSNRNWASDTSTPLAKLRHRNAHLKSVDSEQSESMDEAMFIDVQSRKKRRRERSLQLAVSELAAASKMDSIPDGRPITTQQPVQGRRGGALVIGKATNDRPVGGMKAAKQSAHAPVQKSVFCIDNIDPSCTVTELCDFVKTMAVRIISCFSVKSRRRRSDVEGEATNRQAFRLCIPSEDCSLLLDAEQWPKHIFISEWFFKSADPVAPVKIGDVIGNKLAKMRLAAFQSDVTTVDNAAQRSPRGSGTEHNKGSHPHQSTGDDVILTEDKSPTRGIHQRLHMATAEVHEPARSSDDNEINVLFQTANSDVDDVMDDDVTILTQDNTQQDDRKTNDGSKK